MTQQQPRRSVPPKVSLYRRVTTRHHLSWSISGKWECGLGDACAVEAHWEVEERFEPVTTITLTIEAAKDTVSDIYTSHGDRCIRSDLCDCIQRAEAISAQLPEEP